jgi:hypothetical protein
MTLRSAASAMLRPPVSGVLHQQARPTSQMLRPSGSYAPQQMAAPVSQRPPQTPAQPAKGMVVSVEASVLAIIGVMVALVVAFYLGMLKGRDEALTSGKQATSPQERAKPPVPAGPAEGIKTVDPGGIKHQDPGDRPKPPGGDKPVPPSPPTSGKWTVEVYRYAGTDQRAADQFARKLSDRGLQGVEVVRRNIKGKTELAVCVGRFDSREDPRAEQTKQAVINIDRKRFAGVVELVKLD